MGNVFKNLNIILSKRDKQFISLLFVFAIVISIIETVGISIIMPFMSVASDFSIINTNKYFNLIYTYLGFSKEIDFVIAFGVFLIIFYVLRSGINLLYFYVLSKFAKGRYHLISMRLFSNYLGMSYRDFIEKNSSELNKTIINEALNLTVLIMAVLLMISEVFVIIFIYSILMYINWQITLLLTLILGINVIILVKLIFPKVKQAGVIREENQKHFYEVLNSSFGNFKIIKLKSTSQEILKRFETSSNNLAKANITNETLFHFPRLFLEGIAFSIVALIIIFLVLKYESNISQALALVSIFVLGLYRLMPSANRIFMSYNQIIYNLKSLEIVHQDIIFPKEELKDDNISFDKSIKLDNIFFEYIKDKPILQNISLQINKGDSVAFIGESGSGKSTLIDIIIGLYQPLSGQILIDGKAIDDTNIKSWRKKVGYIPQNVYLFDGTVAQNVAFSEEIDEDRVKEVLKKANILDFLQTHQNGIDTVVGEGGIKLSGGQKQRIAIARALYDNPEILVLDEATSALDNDTEAKIMDEIYDISKGKTLIIIAHRLSTIDRCKMVYRLQKGVIIDDLDKFNH